MNNSELSPLTVKFAEPTGGFWDGGKKEGGVFEPSVRYTDDPDRSYVEWGCWSLNHYFRFPLHVEKGANKGKPLTKQQVMSRARRYLVNKVRVPHTVS